MATVHRDEVVIRGDLVEIQRTQVLKQIKLAEFIPFLATPPDVTTPRLPRNTAFLRWSPENNQFDCVVELTPGIYPIRTSRMTHSVMCAMPWQYGIFTATTTSPENANWTLNKYLLVWTKERVRTGNELAVAARLPNIYDGTGRICFGTTGTNAGAAIDIRIDTIMNEFFATTFNDHLGYHRPTKYRSFSQWGADTIANPEAYKTWDDWEDYGVPFHNYWNQANINAPVVNLEGEIPAYTPGNSFGRAAEWLQTLRPVDRLRLLKGFKTISEQNGGYELPFDPDLWEPIDGPALEEMVAAQPVAVATPPSAPASTGIFCDCPNDMNVDCHCDAPVRTVGSKCATCARGVHVRDNDR